MEEPSSSNTRPSLLVRIRDHLDQESWQAFVDSYAPLVYRYARRKGLQDADAADITQEVMAEVARCIRSFEYQPDRGRFRDWMGTLAHRRLVRHFEKLGRVEGDVPLSVDESSSAPADSEWTDEFNARIFQLASDRARPHFEPETWSAFEKVWIEGRPAGEVAAEMGRPIDWVYVAKSRVLKRLEREVLELAEDVPQVVRPY
jgi:RNA polymerase sigma factor (sigma-70 family)